MPNSYPLSPTPVVPFAEVLHSGLSIASQRTAANDAWAVLNGGLSRLASDSALLNRTYLGAGRFVSATSPSTGAPTSGTGLTLRVLNGTYMVQGRVFVVANAEPSPYAVIANIAPSKPGGVEVFVGIDSATGLLKTLPEWQFDTLPDTNPLGLYHLGRAVTTSGAVTGFTASTLEGQGIISPRGTGTVAGVDGDGDPVDLSGILARLAALEASVGDLEAEQEVAAQGPELMLQDVARAFDLIGELAAGVAEVNPHSTERSQLSVIVANSGNGEDSTPNFSPTTGAANELALEAGSYSP